MSSRDRSLYLDFVKNCHSLLMDSQWMIWFSVVLVFFCFNKLLVWKNKRSLPLPPRPPAWPIAGNLFQLGKKPNESLWALSQQYGPLMTLSLGLKTVVVVSSSEMAKAVLKTHDQIFAGRSLLQAATTLSHHKSSIAWAQYGPYWRKLRRISTTELMSPKRLHALQHLRNDGVFRTMRLIFEDKEKIVNIGHLVFYTSMNLMGNMIFSKSVFDPNNPGSVEFKEAFTKSVILAGKSNLADFFPFFRFVDLQGVRREMSKYFKRVYGFLDVLLDDRMKTRTNGLDHQTDTAKDFLDVLLDLKADDLTLADIRALVFELMAAGSDTTAAAIEWAMAELIHSPHTMQRAQQELEKVVGRSRKVEESDIDSLPYLQAVVKEVFRLHPSLPLGLPHRADSSCEIAGFMIPKHTQVILNLWAIGRDPEKWKEPSKFMPQRFLEATNSKIGYKGNDFDLIPFGAGRRICMGVPLADKIVHFAVASLLHSFDWNLPNGMSGEELDMSDMFGVVLRKAAELRVIPTPRLPHHLY